MSKSNVNRRRYLQTSAAGAAALSLTAASASRVYGADERIGIGFVGVGGRCQAHLNVINRMRKEDKGVAPVAVCECGTATKKSAGDFISAEKVGLNPQDKTHVTKDYRKLLDLKDVDVVCVATPDHWHAKMSIDAAAAGKDVYCEKPMTKTIAEAQAVVEPWKKHNRVMTVGVQSMADPTWLMANEMIASGKIGHVAQAQTSYYRNSHGRPVALLPAHEGHDPENGRLENVPGQRFPRHRGRAPGPRRCRSTAPSTGNGAATGTSAAACSPTCSSTRPRT